MATDQASAPSQAAVDSAVQRYNAIRAVFPEAVTDFESRWDAAQAVCQSQSQSTSTSDDSDEFNSIKKLGPKAIPFVVYKLAQDDIGKHKWGVYLYNVLENDPLYRPNIDGQNLLTCSARIVDLNYQRNKLVDDRIAAWKQLHEENMPFHSGSTMYTFTDEYGDLLQMGTSIIAPLMVAYHENQFGFWWDLLHEIVRGHKTGAVHIQMDAFYKEWDSFFRWREHDQAPDYILTPLDRQVRFGEVVDATASPRRWTQEDDARL